MINVRDVEQDIAGNNRIGLEQAFRTLIGYPGEGTIEGADTADGLLALLYRVSFALQDDEDVIPGPTMELLRGAARRRSVDRNTYGEGGQLVLDDLDYWHAIFSRQVADASG